MGISLTIYPYPQTVSKVGKKDQSQWILKKIGGVNLETRTIENWQSLRVPAVKGDVFTGSSSRITKQDREEWI